LLAFLKLYIHCDKRELRPNEKRIEEPPSVERKGKGEKKGNATPTREMTESHQSTPRIPVSSSSDTFSKDIEVQSIPSESIEHDDSDIDPPTRREILCMTEKGDIEAYPDGVNDPQNEEWSGGKEGAVTRTSTKSSWKDPGPPPDGGWVGWTQGVLALSFSSSIPAHMSRKPMRTNS
jgi:hypothetical protein